MSGSDKCWKKIKGAKGTENYGKCYLRQDGKPLLIRWHLNRDQKEVSEWVMWAPEGIASAKVPRWEYVWCVQGPAAGANMTSVVSDGKNLRRGPIGEKNSRCGELRTFRPR